MIHRFEIYVNFARSLVKYFGKQYMWYCMNIYSYIIPKRIEVFLIQKALTGTVVYCIYFQKNNKIVFSITFKVLQ